MVRLVSALVLSVLVLSSCGAPRTADRTQAPADLVVYSSHPADLLFFLVKEFRERTGLRVSTVQAGTGALLDRLQRELGSPAADVMLGGGVESLEAARDLFESYRSPEAEALPAAFQAPDGRWTGFSVLSVVIVYNRRLLDPLEAPRSWADLADPRFAGLIASSDPRTSGSAYSQVRALASIPGAAPDLQERFVRNLKGRPFIESTRVGPAVSSGEAQVGLTFDTYSPWPDVVMVHPAEGTLVLPDGLALVKGAPHPEAGRRFIDFLLGRDVGAILVSHFQRRSVRSDVADPEGVVPLARLSPLDYDVQAAAQEKARTLELFTTVFEGR